MMNEVPFVLGHMMNENVISLFGEGSVKQYKFTTESSMVRHENHSLSLLLWAIDVTLECLNIFSLSNDDLLIDNDTYFVDSHWCLHHHYLLNLIWILPLYILLPNMI
eukprot:122255_1